MLMMDATQNHLNTRKSAEVSTRLGASVAKLIAAADPVPTSSWTHPGTSMLSGGGQIVKASFQATYSTCQPNKKSLAVNLGLLASSSTIVPSSKAITRRPVLA